MGGVGAAAPWPPESQERRRGRKSRTRKKKNEGSPIFKEKGEGRVWFAEIRGFSDDL